MATFQQTKQRILSLLRALNISEAEARRESELILLDATECNTAQQTLRAFDHLSDAQEMRVNAILQQREQRVPLQYCLGHTWFMDSRLEVRSGVFIPRSDTEALVLRAFDLISASDNSSRTRTLQIAEVGIGSGAISISLLKLLPNAVVSASDILPTACRTARANAEANGVSERLGIECGDWRNLLPHDIDLFVSNPPYIPRADEVNLLPEVAHHEPIEALYGSDDDGMGFYREFAKIIPAHFRDGHGALAVEIGDEQSGSVSQIFVSAGWAEVTVSLDMNGLPRVVTALK